MFPTAIASSILAVLAAFVATRANVPDVWLATMIGAFALVLGSVVCMWSLGTAKATRRPRAKLVLATIAGIALVPSLLIGLALFTFTLLPALVIILPLVAWDFGALARIPKAARLIPANLVRT